MIDAIPAGESSLSKDVAASFLNWSTKSYVQLRSKDCNVMLYDISEMYKLLVPRLLATHSTIPSGRTIQGYPRLQDSSVRHLRCKTLRPLTYVCNDSPIIAPYPINYGGAKLRIIGYGPRVALKNLSIRSPARRDCCGPQVLKR